jgi:hypothetical protein
MRGVQWWERVVQSEVADLAREVTRGIEAFEYRRGQAGRVGVLKFQDDELVPGGVDGCTVADGRGIGGAEDLGQPR